MSTLEDLTALANRGFSERNLSDLLDACERLLEKRRNALVIFTLKGLFSDLFDFYSKAPVTAERANVLTAGLKDKILELLSNIDSVTSASLEELVLLYQSNKVKLRARTRSSGGNPTSSTR